MNANQACRENNTDRINANEDVPTKGGNMVKYSKITGQDKYSECEQYTMVKFDGDDAMEFVALELAMDWEREGKEGKSTPLLDPQMQFVGISNQPHKKTNNIIQVLYIK